jgi:glc operon protein GlcG
MRKVCLAVFVLVSSAIPGLSAQNAPPPQAAPAAATPAPPPPQTIDLATAKKMIAAAEAAAIGMNAHVAIWVLDSNGDVVMSERMDMATPRAVTSSLGKARAALLFGMPTAQVATAMRSGMPVTATLNPPVAGASELTIVQGGLPIMKNGKLIGAIGAGGSASANDEKFAQAGIDAVMEK